MFAVMVVGAGRIGASIAKLLHNSGDYEITVADQDAAVLERLEAAAPSVRLLRLEVDRDTRQLAGKLRSLSNGRRAAVLSACSFDVNQFIALSALEAGVSYFDLTEDVETTRRVRELASEAPYGQIFMPQCGLAPGFIGILAASMMNRFDRLDAIHMRVGALPEYPHNPLDVPPDVVHGRHDQRVLQALRGDPHGPTLAGKCWRSDGLERFAIDGVEYEAFNTFRRPTGRCAKPFEGKRVNELNYKTVRYPGHHYLMDFLT